MTSKIKGWNLIGKKALVTGGSKGIGKATVEELASLGAEVLFTARNEKELDATKKEFIGKGYTISTLCSDISNAAGRTKIASWINDSWQRLDILVNNAGINFRKATNDYTKAEYLSVLNTNLIAPFELCRLLFNLLVKAKESSIINVGSVAGFLDVQTGAPYGISKSGVLQMTRNLAAEWAKHNIRVNSVSPWFTETPLTSGLLANTGKLQAITRRTPMGRIAQAYEISAAIAFLAMNKASYITGQNIIVDGGMSINAL
jgi:tropinone reductase I